MLFVVGNHSSAWPENYCVASDLEVNLSLSLLSGITEDVYYHTNRKTALNWHLLDMNEVFCLFCSKFWFV